MPEIFAVAADALPSFFAVVVGRALRILLRVRWWHLVTLFLVATLYWLVPFVGSISTKEIEALGGRELIAAQSAVSGKHGVPPAPPGLVVPVNPLVRGIITVGVGWDADGVTYATAANNNGT